MLIPSIDLMGGRIVQLERGQDLKLAYDDFNYWLERFSPYPLVQLVDLDAAMRQGENRALIHKICQQLPCQVGGGISSIESAEAIVAAGARRVIVGSALFQQATVNCGFAEDLASAVGPERVVCSIDAKGGLIAVKGWKEQVSLAPEDVIRQLDDFCGAFLYTHIDTEGTLQGFPVPIAERLRALTSKQLIVAGGIRNISEIEELAAMGVDAVAGMAVYMGLLPV